MAQKKRPEHRVDRHNERNLARIRPRTYEAIRSLAKRNGRTITQEIESALLHWLAEHDMEPNENTPPDSGGVSMLTGG